MYESFYLQIIRNVLSYTLNLSERKLPCTDNSFYSHIVPELVSHVVCIVCLCTDMYLHIRHNLSCQTKYSRISYKHCIYPDVLYLSEISLQTFDILIMSKDIYSNIYLNVMSMSILNSLLHLFNRKVVCFSSESEAAAAHIYSIRSIVHGNLQSLHTACRHKQFRFSIIHHIFLTTETATPSPIDSIAVSSLSSFLSVYRYSLSLS